jgi:hypothetical protein
MKTCTFFNSLGFGFLLCGGYIGNAQQVLFSTPIVVQLAEIDRHHVYVHPRKNPLNGSTLSVVFKVLKQAKVDELVRSGVVLRSSVWVMEGQKLLLTGSLVGEAICPGSEDGKNEYGFLLCLGSTEDAEKAAALLSLGPDPQEVDSQMKK